MSRVTGFRDRRFFGLAPAGLFLGGLLLATVAFAQDGAADLSKLDSLTPEQTLSQSQKYMSKMRETQTNIQKLQDQARSKKHIIKLNCVSDKLVQVKGHLAVADQSFTALNTAAARGDDAGRKHEYTRMTILFEKVTVLGTEAENCIGEDASYIGSTKVDVDIDPNIPDDDPTQPQLPLPDVSRPPEASPFV